MLQGRRKLVEVYLVGLEAAAAHSDYDVCVRRITGQRERGKEGHMATHTLGYTHPQCTLAL